MNWFKMIWLNSEERQALRIAKQNKSLPVANAPEDIRPYRNIIYSNGNLTVVMKDGTALSRSNASQDIFDAVRSSISQEQIERLMIINDSPVSVKSSKNEVETPEDRALINNNLSILRFNDEFEIKGTDVYLKGVNLAMPAPVVASFIELLEKHEDLYLQDADEDCFDEVEEQLQALKMFWLKLALNPLAQSREDLLAFVRLNDVRITRNGNLILYRRIVSNSGADTELVTFVSQNYYKLKKEGEDPRNFAIGKGIEGYVLIDLNRYVPNDDPGEVQPFCNLQQAYLELPTFDTNTFTAWHDRTVDIKLGGIYKIPENMINLDNGICAAGGLHAAAVDYNYSGFGDLPVVVLVNPSKAITVPVNETGKLRTTEMFIACVNDKPLGTHFDESALSVFDEEYHDMSLVELEVAAKTKSFKVLSVKEEVPAVSLVDLNTIRAMLRDRIKLV